MSNAASTSAVSQEIRVSADEVLPIAGRAAWLDKHGAIPSDISVKLRASLSAWERFGATIKADRTIEIRDRVLLRQLQMTLCKELRREPKSRTRDEDETAALLETARFGALCEMSPLPKDSFPAPGEEYDKLTTPWFVPGDPRVPWSKEGQQYQCGFRIVYGLPQGEMAMPQVVAINGPFELKDYEALPAVEPYHYGRLLARIVGD